LFWVQRLKHEDQDATWAISYGDMMSLLLAVFVMIAAMSELKPGAQFASVRDAMRGALGFAGVEPRVEPSGWTRPLTLSEQFARAGLTGSAGGANGLADESLRCCDVSPEDGGLVIRIAGSASFESFSAALLPQGQAAVERLASLLKRGEARIEVRGFNGDGKAPVAAMYRDGLDLSYARARSVVNALIFGGVNARRIFISACGDQNPLVPQRSGEAPTAANRRIEIVVHAVKAIEGNDQFAEKGQFKNAH
jgi:chemotaxis protein MotB